jgi:hypothetical protein
LFSSRLWNSLSHLSHLLLSFSRNELFTKCRCHRGPGLFHFGARERKLIFLFRSPTIPPVVLPPSLSWLHEPSLPYSCLHLLLTVLEARSASLGDHPLFILQIQKKSTVLVGCLVLDQ